MKAHSVAYCSLFFSVTSTIRARRRFVPDAKTAVKIAEAVLIPVYGETQVEPERPFKAVLENGIWTATCWLLMVRAFGSALDDFIAMF